MSEWQTVAIGEICDLVTSGGTPLTSQKEYYHNGSIPWVKTKEVNQCRLYGTENHITQLGLDNSSAKLIPENSIIIAMYGDGKTAGRVALNKVPVTTNQACCNLILNKQKANYDFVFYNLMGRYDELVSKKTGSGQQNLNGKIIKEIEIDLPPLPEQKAIASVLSSLDDKIDLLHRQNKTLEAMAETLFRQWFIEEAKEDWEIFQLQDLAKLQIGRTPPRKESHWFSDNTNDMKWVSIKDLGAHGIFVTYSSEYLPISTIDHFNIPIIPEGTVMLSFKMTVGRVGIAIENMVSNEAIAQFQIKKRLTSELLYCFLKQFNFDTLGSTSSIVTAVNTALLKGIEIALPEDDLIQEFTEQVKSYFDKVKANQLQIQTLENLRDTLLPKLMSGEVRVQYQTEEVA